MLSFCGCRVICISLLLVRLKAGCFVFYFKGNSNFNSFGAIKGRIVCLCLVKTEISFLLVRLKASSAFFAVSSCAISIPSGGLKGAKSFADV